MSIPNTHTGVFTRIPEYIEKEWTNKPVSTQKEAPPGFHNSTLHMTNALTSVTVIAKYDSALNSSEATEYDENDDDENDMVELWKQQRKLWAELEHAVNNVLQEYAYAQIAMARDKKMRSVDVPLKRKTRAGTLRDTETLDEPRTQTCAAPINHNTERAEEMTTVSRVRTVAPGDSVSQIGVDDMARIIRDSVRSVRRERQRESTREPSRPRRDSGHFFRKV